jgi:hypothetical protein
MVLVDLIKPHVVKNDRGWNVVPPNVARTLAKQVEGWFTNLGWKVRVRKGRKDNAEDFKFTAQKGHVSIRYQIEARPHTTVHYRSEGGGTVKDDSWNYWSSDLQEAVDHALKIPFVAKLSKTNLPEPFSFKDVPLVAVKRKNLSNPNPPKVMVQRTGQIAWIAVKGVVGIDDKGVVSMDQVMVPGETPYFYLSCASPTGATYNLITDGEMAYAVQRYGKQRVTSDPNPKSSVDLTKLTSQDKELVQIAITGYLNQDELEWI